MTTPNVLVGYARVSTTDQNPQLQLDALNAVGCARIFTDRASGAKTNRPELAAALDYLRRGDTLCIWRLDRLGRSLPHLIEVANVLTERGVALRSLTEQIDTNSAGGRSSSTSSARSLSSNEPSSRNAPSPASRPPEPAAAPEGAPA